MAARIDAIARKAVAGKRLTNKEIRSLAASALARRKNPCCHCRKRLADHVWTLRPCALGRAVKLHLCTICDALLNERVLTFMNHPRVKQLMKKYRRGNGR